MPPKNDALKGAYIAWSTKEDDVIGKITSSKLSDDGFTFTAELDLNSIITTFPKEKMMNKNEKLKDVNCICVFKDGDEVKAVAMRDVHNVLLEGSNLYTDYGSGSKVVVRASAKCNPNDIFDFNIGAKLALDRLYEGYDMTPKPRRKPYNGKIFVAKYPGNALKSHKIYQVRNGCIQPATIGRSPYIFEDMDDAEMSWVIHTTIYDRYAAYGALTSNMTRAYFVNE